jgi:beta-glucanase (GH16 family)
MFPIPSTPPTAKALLSLRPLALGWTIALCTASCGGGGADNSSDPAFAGVSNKSLSNTAATPTLAEAPVQGPEILQNPSFDADLQAWSIQDAGSTALVPSEIRAGKQALRVGSDVTQRLLVGKLEPGKSYSLIVSARVLGAGNGELALVFREPIRNETFRTFKAAVTSTSYTDVRLDFTVPAYSGVVDLVLKVDGAPFTVDSASLKMRSDIVQTEPILSTVGSTVPEGYALAFNDEFNGTQLNRSKWFTRYMYSNETLDRLNDEQQRYRDNDNHQVANGVLSLVARKVGTTDPSGINYESGMVRSDWTAHYGYYEARVKMPGGKGAWAAFWLDADVAADGLTGWPPEIDIFEFVNDGLYETLNMIHSNVHVAAPAASVATFSDPAWNEQWQYWMAPYNFNDGWHTVGVEWTPDTATTYIDGRKIVSRGSNWLRPDGLAAGPAHILLNLAIGGSWAGRNGVDDTAFPQALQIDWVRAYKKVN